MKKIGLLGIILLVIFISSNILLAQGSENSLHFDGINDYARISNSPSINITDSISIAVWVKAPVTNQNDWARILDKSFSGVGNRQYNIAFNSDGTLPRVVIDNTNGGTYDLVANTSIADNEWHHIAITFESTDSLKIYIDGELDAGMAVNYPAVQRAQDVVLGSIAHSPGSSLVFEGGLDELSIWNEVLSEQEIRERMCSHLGGDETGLVGYWRMNEGTNNTCNGGKDICDLSGNDNHGTLQ